MDIKIDPDFTRQILKDFVSINSVNPSLSPDGAGEAEIATYVADTLTSFGLDTQTMAVAPGRLNAIGTLHGSGNGPSLMLNAHMDTVGVEGMQDPFGATERDGKLYGRGAQDMKASLAAMVAAAQALSSAGVSLKGDFVIAGVADEEYISMGTDALVKHLRTDAAIVTEPTDLTIGRAHRGFIWFDVETFGRAAHGSRYAEGIDANMRMGRYLAKLDQLEQALRARPGHPLVGPPSLHAARLQGGDEISTYAAHCLLQIERRTIPGETEAQALGELQALLDEIVAADPAFSAAVQPTFRREPFEVGPNAQIVQVLTQAAAPILKKTPQHSGQSFWTDAAILADAGIETVLIGPVGGGLHSEIEWVDLQSVFDLAQILTNTALAYCGVTTS